MTSSVPVPKSECGPRGHWFAEATKVAAQVWTLPARWSGEGGGREDRRPLQAPSTVAMTGRGHAAVLTSLPSCLSQACQAQCPVRPGGSRRAVGGPCGGQALRWAGPATTCSRSVLEA